MTSSFKNWVVGNNLQHEPRDEKLAAEALAWASSQPIEGVSDYLYNLGVACRAGYVTRRTVGLVASCISAYQRHIEAVEEKRVNAAKSQHVGTLKKREVFKDLTVFSVKYFDGEWGTSTLVVFKDKSGNLIKWFASKSLDDLNMGDLVNMKATVKKHGEYKGVKETVITRAVILEMVV